MVSLGSGSLVIEGDDEAITKSVAFMRERGVKVEEMSDTDDMKL